MAYDVTMPQLGMTQDSGIIVSWVKALGDPVKSGDVLMEVETDKATMEVEALNDGFLTEIRSPAGSDVPVGNVVAVISSNAHTIVETSAVNDTQPPAATKPPVAPKEDAGKPFPTKPATGFSSAGLVSEGKILASPKAKQEAKRRGINLSVLARRGGVQPFHYADILQAKTSGTNFSSGNLVISAKLSRKDLISLQNWITEEMGTHLDIGIIIASFASGALRACGGIELEETVQCDIRSASQIDGQYSVIDADQNGLTTQQIVGGETDGKLVIYDLTNTSLTGFSPSIRPGQIAIVLTETSKKKLGLHCHYDEFEFSTDKALAFTSDLAGRVSEPLRNLL